IRLAHWDRGDGWSAPETISPISFTDLPNPLPGFAFRTNSFPAMALIGDHPRVVWTSYDSGVGRAYVWARGHVTTVSDSGDDQFFPSVSGGVHQNWTISWSQTNDSDLSVDQYMSDLGVVQKISTASSFPNSD